MTLSGRPLVLAMSVGEIGTLLPNLAFAALTPFFIASWGISSTAAGWIAGISGLGYMAAVPLLMGLTDRIDARRVFIVGGLTATIGHLGFALAATGFWSALFWRAISGVGLAGTYMPGLRSLTDRYEAADKSRAIAFYTASYSVGVSLSYLLTGLLADAYGWRVGIALLAIGPLIAVLIAWLAMAPVQPKAAVARRLLDFRPVFANRRALGYILAYGAHGFELTAMRAWMVAFLAYASALAGHAGAERATLIAALFSVIGLPSSLLGNELARRFDRRLVLIALMSGSALLGAGIGFAPGLPYGFVVMLVLIYAVTLTADSGALTAGVVAAATPETQGATVALHSTIGFSASFLGPLAVGMALDAAGGPQAPWAWTAGFLVMAAGAAAGPLALWILGRRG